MTVAEAIRDYGTPVAWLVIAVGWWVTNRQENSRERRKEIRAEMLVLSELIASVVDLVRSHRRANIAAQVDLLSAHSVYTTLFEIDLRLERLLERKFKLGSEIHRNDCRVQRERLFDLASGDDAISKQLNTQEMGDMLVSLHSQAHILINSLHKLFVNEFEGL